MLSLSRQFLPGILFGGGWKRGLPNPLMPIGILLLP
jgi:hypothetical protein